VTRVTLDIQPSFQVRQDAYAGLPWAAVLSDLDAIMASAYSVSLMTGWSGRTVDRLWLKTRLPDATPPALARLGAVATPLATMWGGEGAILQLNPFSVAGPWSERLAHFRPDCEPGTVEQIQSEYMVPRARAAEALSLLHGMGARIDRDLLLTEIRSMAADALWLSPAYGADALAIHFTWKRAPAAVATITRDIEDMLLPLGGRPHWGKLMHARADRLAPLYPRLAEFRELACAYDPGGKFRNAFLDTHVFG
jgi:xylitol oxidase